MLAISIYLNNLVIPISAGELETRLYSASDSYIVWYIQNKKAFRFFHLVSGNPLCAVFGPVINDQNIKVKLMSQQVHEYFLYAVFFIKRGNYNEDRRDFDLTQNGYVMLLPCYLLCKGHL